MHAACSITPVYVLLTRAGRLALQKPPLSFEEAMQMKQRLLEQYRQKAAAKDGVQKDQ
jgi:hypothetical protein